MGPKSPKPERGIASGIVPFSDVTKDDAPTLGGKGSSLGELTRLRLPVPPGFVISTDAARAIQEGGQPAAEIFSAVRQALHDVETSLGRRFGDPRDPLLISVRSGAPVSMPGMMDTVLNIGTTPATIPGLARRFGNAAFAADCHHRLVRSFATTIRGLGLTPPGSAIDNLSVAEIEAALDTAGLEPIPEDADEQLRQAILAVVQSWDSPRARRYRRFKRITDTGTALVIQAMVFGNAGASSGTGVMFTRDPGSGENRLYGDFLPNAQGEDIVAGTHNTQDLDDLRAIHPEVVVELERVARLTEGALRDMCEIEFTLELGQLWVLQARVGQRSARAAVRIAAELAGERLIDPETALERVPVLELQRELRPALDVARLQPEDVLAHGIGGSPGVVSGRLALDTEQAEQLRSAGHSVILARTETSPEDLAGILAATGLLTTRGGKTSHAAVVARGLGRCCVCGAEEVTIDTQGRTIVAGERIVAEGDLVSLDGDGGRVILGAAPVTEPGEQIGLRQLLAWADAARRISVWARVSNEAELTAALTADAEGVIVDLGEPTIDRPWPRLSEVSVPVVLRLPSTARVGDWLRQLRETADAYQTATGSPLNVILRADMSKEFPDPPASIAILVEQLLAPGELTTPQADVYCWADSRELPATPPSTPPVPHTWAIPPRLDESSWDVVQALNVAYMAVAIPDLTTARLLAGRHRH